MAEIAPKSKPVTVNTNASPSSISTINTPTITTNSTNSSKPPPPPLPITTTSTPASRRPAVTTLHGMINTLPVMTMMGSAKIGVDRAHEPAQVQTGNTWTSISADCDLLTWPIPVMLGMTDLASSLQTYCSSWIQMSELRVLQDDMNALAAELMNEHLYLYVDAQSVHSMDRKGVVKASFWSVHWWRSLFDFGKQHTEPDTTTTTMDEGTTDNDDKNETDRADRTRSNGGGGGGTNNTAGKPVYGVVARQQFDNRKFIELVEQFNRAYSIMQRWNNVCALLAANRERARSTQIFQCAWKSGLNQQDYVDTALPLHSVMWAVTCASLAFNLGRRCEVLRGDTFKMYYENAFRLLYHVAYNELCTWTNHESSDIGDCPPEARIDTCTAYMRMCLMRMQLCTIQHVEFNTINQPESTEQTNITNARTMFRLALYLQSQVTSMLPAEHSFINIASYRAPSLYQPGAYVQLSLARAAEYYELVAKAYQCLATVHFYHYDNVAVQAATSNTNNADGDVRAKVMIQHRACAMAAVECIASCKALIKFLSVGGTDSGMARIVFEQFWIPYLFRYWLLVIRPKFEQKRGDVWSFPTMTEDDSNTSGNNSSSGTGTDDNNIHVYNINQVNVLAVRFEASIATSMQETNAVANILPAAVSIEPCMYLNAPDKVYDRFFSLGHGLLQPMTLRKQ